MRIIAEVRKSGKAIGGERMNRRKIREIAEFLQVRCKEIRNYVE